MTKCLVVQHVEPEGPYVIGDALAAAGASVERCLVYAGDRVPAHARAYDGIVVMGGPMSAAGGPAAGSGQGDGNEQGDDGFATCRVELELLRSALDAGVPTLGVCLGSQLLARAAGATVAPGTHGPEIGWGPIDLTAHAGTDPLLGGIPGPLTVLHWHGDTFDLPPGSVHLASSDRYPNQAFRVGASAWGFQCHLEVDGAAVAAFLAAFGGEADAVAAGSRAIEAATALALDALAGARDLVAARFARLVVGHADVRVAAGATDAGIST